jgi:hypothetical protein
MYVRGCNVPEVEYAIREGLHEVVQPGLPHKLGERRRRARYVAYHIMITLGERGKQIEELAHADRPLRLDGFMNIFHLTIGSRS